MKIQFFYTQKLIVIRNVTVLSYDVAGHLPSAPVVVDKGELHKFMGEPTRERKSMHVRRKTTNGLLYPGK